MYFYSGGLSGDATETKTPGNASASPSLVTVGGDTAALNAARSPQPSAAQSSGAAQAAAKQQHTPATAKMLAGEQDAARPMFLIRPNGHSNSSQWLQLGETLKGARKKLNLSAHYFQNGKKAYQHGQQRTLPSGDVILAIKSVNVYRHSLRPLVCSWTSTRSRSIYW